MLDFSICDVYRGDEAFLCKNVSGPHSYVLLITFLSAFLCTGDLCKGVAFAQKRRCTYFIQGQWQSRRHGVGLGGLNLQPPKLKYETLWFNGVFLNCRKSILPAQP